jgi:hypothetical protein
MGTDDGPTGVEAEARTAPTRIRLPGFLIEDDEIGLGDVIQRAAYRVGLPSCGGCGQRAVALNRWVIFSR